MMVPLVRPAVLLRELDPVTFDRIDGTDVNAIRANDFHVLAHLAEFSHVRLPSRFG
jgi:hypothetical protein